jgi:hypothetical protein
VWDGVRDPYLYTATVDLLRDDGRVADRVTQTFGLRTFTIDPDRGLILNGRPYPIHRREPSPGPAGQGLGGQRLPTTTRISG